MLTPPDQSTRKPLFDADAIAAELEELVPHYEGQKELRIAVAMRLKRALADARKAAEANLLKDRLGLRCAADLCLVQDQIIRVCSSSRPNISTRRKAVRKPSAWRSWQPAATGAA
jgi:hypothetical protein